MKKFWNWLLSLFGKKKQESVSTEPEPEPENVQDDGASDAGQATNEPVAWQEPEQEPENVQDDEPDTPAQDTEPDCGHEPETASGIIHIEESGTEVQDAPDSNNLQAAVPKNTMLSPHFSLHELTSSATARRYGIDNTPNDVQTANLVLLCQKVLEPIRIKYGKPIVVSSGFRCTALNRKVGGASTSQHVSGQAADIHSVSDTLADNKALYDLIVKSGIVFDQLIYEYGNSTGPDWIHISFNGKGNRMQKLKASKANSKTVYTVVK